MATYQFSALADGQAISFNPTADVLNFDQSAIAAADIRVTASGTSTRIEVVAGPQAGKDITLLNATPFQLATSNVTFVDGSRLLFGDNSTATGDDNGNVLTGGTGRDLILAFGGSDTINVGTASHGNDFVDGGSGYDTLNFSGYVTTGLVVDFATGTATSSGGTVTFANIERFAAGSGNDIINGNAANQNIGAVAGNDTIWGAGGNDTLFSGLGADTFVFREYGTANADLMGDFTSGTDKILLDATVMTALGSGDFAAGDPRFWAAAGATGGHDADDRVVYNPTTRQLFYDADGSGSGAAQLIATLQSGATLVATDIVVDGGGMVINGTAGDDSLAGGPGNDTLNGFGDNDTLNGLGGNDWLEGHGGVDHFMFSVAPGAANADRIFDFAWGTDKLHLDATVMTELGTTGNFQTADHRFYVAAGATGGHDVNDRVIFNTTTRQVFYDADGSGSGAAQLIATLTPGASLAATDIVVENGTAAGGVFTGTQGDDTITGSSGDDTITGLGGGDNLSGNAGNDSLDGGAGRDNLYGGEGNDTLVAGDNDASGQSQLMEGGLGEDVMIGSATGDVYIVDSLGDTLSDSGGRDAIFVSISYTAPDWAEQLTLMGSDPLTATGNQFNNTVDGNDGANLLRGLGGGDWLGGGAGADTLDGGDGNDTLFGYTGNDRLEGGFGSDNYFFWLEAPSNANADSIVDFASGQDYITLDGRVFANLGADGRFASGDARFFAGPGASSGQDTTDRVIYDTTTGELWYDADGSGANAAQLIATLQSGATLVASDIHAVNGSGGIVVNGTSGNDSLLGTTGDDTINGFGGNDTIDGQAGNDRLDGGTGNDSVEGGEGADLIIGGEGNDTLSAGFIPGHGDGFIDTLNGGMGDDVYIVSDDPDTILADPGGLDTVLLRTNGEFTLTAGLENLEIQGGDGGVGIGNELDNLIRAGGEGSAAYGMGGNDRLFVFGFQGAYVNGGEGNDTLGAATFHGATMEGGSGADTFTFGDPSGTLIADFASGSDKILLDATGMPALGATGNFAINDARFYAAAGATSGHDADDRVIYNTSTGELFYDSDGSGAQAAELISTLQSGATLVATDIAVDNGTGGGTPGNDSLVGTPGNDTLEGLAGNDTLRGLDGDDFLDGGSGVDSLDGGLGYDAYVVTAGDVIAPDPGGIDTVYTPVSWNISSGNLENIVMTGTSNVSVEGNNLANRIIGNDAPNYINARAGSDTLIGNGGNDTFNMSRGGTASFGNDSIDGGAGVDTVEFGINAVSGLVADLAAGTVSGGEANGAGSSTIVDIERFIAGDFNDVVTGSAVANYVDARAGNDTVSGAAGTDTLIGGTGNDRLAGGTGVDSMAGGAGLDSFVFAEAGTANADRITDFVSASDKVALDDAGFANIGALGNFAAGDGRFWAAAGATSGHDANDRVIYNTSTGSLYYDADGSGAGAAQLIATFTGNPAIAATDITVI